MHPEEQSFQFKDSGSGKWKLFLPFLTTTTTKNKDNTPGDVCVCSQNWYNFDDAVN